MLTNYGEMSTDQASALGKIPGVRYWSKFAEGLIGTNPSTIMSASPTGALLVYPTSEQTVWVASTDTDDNIAGTGCRYMKIFGIDKDFNEIDEIIQMQGQTPVESVNKYIRIYRMFNDDVEPHDLQGQAYLSLSGAGWVGGEPTTVFCHVNDGNNQSQIGVYTVPAGYKLVIKNWWLNSMKDKEVHMWMVYREDLKCDGVTPEKVFRMRSNWGLYRNNIGIDITSAPLVFDHHTEFEIRGQTLGGTEEVLTTMNGYLVPDRYFK